MNGFGEDVVVLKEATVQNEGLIEQFVAVELIQESVLKEFQLNRIGVLVIRVSSFFISLAFSIVKGQQRRLLEALLDVDRIVESISQTLTEGRLAGGNVSADDAY